MFGNGKDHIEKLVLKNKWEKITAMLGKANEQTRLDIAEACSKSSEDESMNTLIRLIRDQSEAVQMQAIKSLGISGRASTKSHLSHLMQNLPEGKDEVRRTIMESLAAISKRT